MRDKIVNIHGYLINITLLSDLPKKSIRNFISLLKHEVIHSKIFKILGTKKTKITIHIQYILRKNIFHFYGQCKPLEKSNLYMLFISDFVHFIYDIIDTLTEFSLNLILWHFREFIIDLKKTIKKIKN